MERNAETVWVGGQEVLAGCTSGKGWSYDVTSKTLTLGGFHYIGEGYQLLDGGAAIWSSGNLKLRLLGSNHVEHTGREGSISIGIFVSGNLTITGDGELTAIGGSLHGTPEAQSIGIACSRELRILSGAVEAAGGNVTDVEEGLSVGIYTGSIWCDKCALTAHGGEGKQSLDVLTRKA